MGENMRLEKREGHSVRKNASLSGKGVHVLSLPEVLLCIYMNLCLSVSCKIMLLNLESGRATVMFSVWVLKSYLWSDGQRHTFDSRRHAKSGYNQRGRCIKENFACFCTIPCKFALLCGLFWKEITPKRAQNGKNVQKMRKTVPFGTE